MNTEIKTKEQILDEHGISKNEFWSPDAAMESMDEYANQQARVEAIAFAEYCNNSCWSEGTTLEKIYELFKERQSKTNTLQP